MGKTLNERAVVDLVINGQQSETTTKQITSAVNNARKALYLMAETDPGYKKQEKELLSLMDAQQKRIVKINQEKTAWEKFKAGGMNMVTSIAGGNLLATGVEKLLELGPAVVDRQMKIRDSFADIAKAADLSDSEVAGLNDQLKKLNTRTSTEDLRGIAVVGGQFGISKADMEGFVESADKLNVALGDQFESVEKVAETSLTLRNTFQDIKSDNIADDMMKIGNGLNYLEAQGAATAPVMADFSSRIGGVAIPLGLTSGQVLGLSATLQELNVTAERGSSAVVDILSGITKAPNDFAKYARAVDGATLSNKQFKDLVNSDLNGALMAVIRGFKEGDTTATGMAAKLDAMGIKGNGALEIFMKLSSNTELLTERQKQSAEALTNTSSITSEFSKKNFDLAVNLKKISEWFDSFLENGTLGKFAGLVLAATVKVLGLSDASNSLAKTYVDQRNQAQQLSEKMNPLLQRYDELTKKAKLSQDEQKELKRLTGLIADNMPAAVTQFDQYAQAIGVSTTKARELIAAQREMAQQMKAQAKEDQQARLRGIEMERKRILDEIKNRESTELLSNGKVQTRALSNDDIAQRRAELEKLQSETFAIIRTMRDLEGMESVADRRKARRAAEPKPEAKPNPAAGSEESEDERKAREKKEKAAARAHQKEVNATQRHEDSLEKMMADEWAKNADATDQNYEKELIQLGNRFKRMYELAGNNKQLQEQITELMYTSLGAIQKKNNDREYKEAEKHSNEMLRIALRDLDNEKKKEQAKVQTRVAAGGITKEQGKLLELQLEEKYLTARELLYTTHFKALKEKAEGNAKETADLEVQSAEKQNEIDSERTDNAADQATARKDIRASELEHEYEMHQKKMQFIREEVEFRRQMMSEMAGLLLNDWTATLKGYKDFWAQASVVQKIAMIASKAFALAEIGIQLARQITLVNTAALLADAVLPFSGEAIRAKGYAIAIGSAALQTAKVLAVNPATPAFEFGGFNVKDNASGYTPSGPTYYPNSNMIAGEKGTEWIMSAPMLRNPVMANLAGALQALQLSGAYKNLSFSGAGSSSSTGSGSATGGNIDALLMALISETQQTRAALDGYAARPISFDVLAHKKKVDDIVFIQQSNKG